MVGRLADLMVFHQSFVTKEPQNIITCVELCSYNAIASVLYLQHIMHDHEIIDITVFALDETVKFVAHCYT